MSVKELQRAKDGKQRFKVHLVQTGPDGRSVEVRKHLVGVTKRDADRWELNTRRAIIDGTHGREEEPKKKIPTFAEYKEEFLSIYAKLHNKPSTVASKEGEIRRYLGPAFGHLALDQIRPADVERLKADLAGRGLSPKTVNNSLGTLSKMLNEARENEVIPAVPRIRFLPVPEQKTDFLTPDELERLLRAASFNPEWQDMILFAARTGLRYGELCELRWGDVDLDLDKGQIRVSRSFTRGKVTDRKNHLAYTVPLSPQAAELLRRRRQLRHLKGNGLVFCKPDGGRHIHRRADVAIKRCCRKAGLREIGFHKLRHTFASQLANKGRALLEIKELCGHEDIKSTMRYAHLMPETRHEAVAVLDQPPAASQQHDSNG